MASRSFRRDPQRDDAADFRQAGSHLSELKRFTEMLNTGNGRMQVCYIEIEGQFNSGRIEVATSSFHLLKSDIWLSANEIGITKDLPTKVQEASLRSPRLEYPFESLADLLRKPKAEEMEKVIDCRVWLEETTSSYNGVLATSYTYKGANESKIILKTRNILDQIGRDMMLHPDSYK
jgi:hypothetical protein